MDIFSLTFKDLCAEMSARYGRGAYHGAALYREIFKKGNASFIHAPEFSASGALGLQLAEDIRFPSCRIAAVREDGATKFATDLGDGCLIESVIIPARGRTTLCVSSQAGCRMGCAFCATGAMGFTRNLSTGEIVFQVHAARHILHRTIDTIVFMGMGEPLDNFDNVARALRVISDPRGLDIAPRHITVSTAGHAQGIRRLAGLNMPNLRLAISLNAADDRLRSRLMPINRTFPLEALKDSLASHPLGRGGVFLIEYVLLSGVNDSREDAKRLCEYLKGLSVRVNLIPYNPIDSLPFAASEPARLKRFKEWLVEEKLFVRTRLSLGRGISAGCGQLGARVLKAESQS